MDPVRTWIVTGANASLGYECSRALAQKPGNLVLLACRDVVRGEEAAEALRRAGAATRVLPLDLASLASVRAFAAAFRGAGLPPLSGLVCNAGLQSVAAPTSTIDGFETTFAVNHLGHYLLARLLLADLVENGAIVFVASGVHDPAQKTGMPKPRYESAMAVAHDLEPGGEAGRRRYVNSKLCNVFTTYEFARRLAVASDARLRTLRVNAFDPGLMPGTGLARTYSAPMRFVWSYVLPALALFVANVNRTSTSGQRLAALVSGEMGGFSGEYVSMGKVFPSSILSHDEAKARELWTASAAMAGLGAEIEGRVT